MKKYIGITIISIILLDAVVLAMENSLEYRREVSGTQLLLRMVYVPQGSYVMGPSDQDVPFANVTSAKTVSVGAFYLDETEITNNEYRQFTNWVRDSIAHIVLGEAGIEGHLIEEDEFGNFLSQQE